MDLRDFRREISAKSKGKGKHVSLGLKNAAKTAPMGSFSAVQAQALTDTTREPLTCRFMECRDDTFCASTVALTDTHFSYGHTYIHTYIHFPPNTQTAVCIIQRAEAKST